MRGRSTGSVPWPQLSVLWGTSLAPCPSPLAAGLGLV